MVFRGPISIKQIAVYIEDTSSHNKRALRADAHHGHHGHQRFHQRKRESRAVVEAEVKRAVGDEVVVTMNGQVVSWKNDYNGGAQTPAPAPPGQPAASPAAAPGPAAPKVAEAPPAVNQQSNPPPAAPSDAPTAAAGNGNFVLQAYYDSKSAERKGLTFLANNLWSQNSAG